MNEAEQTERRMRRLETRNEAVLRLAAGHDDARSWRQRLMREWVVRMFGSANMQILERASRFFEEAVELAQACGLAREDALRIVDYVYAKPKGEPAQEAGGVSITLLALCEALEVDADECERKELRRALSFDKQKLRERHAVKFAAGIARDPEE